MLFPAGDGDTAAELAGTMRRHESVHQSIAKEGRLYRQTLFSILSVENWMYRFKGSVFF